MAEQSQGEKTEQPTARKLETARKQGQVARSVDLSGAAVMLAVVSVMPAAIGLAGPQMLQAFEASLTQIPHTLDFASLGAVIVRVAQPALLAFGIIAGVALLVGVGVNFAQVGFKPTLEPMAPKLTKIDPIQGTKRLFSARAVFEGGKTLVKGLLFGWIAWATISDNWTKLTRLTWLEPVESAGVVGALVGTIGTRVAVAWIVIAALDYFFQRKQTMKQLMMTKDELRREMKEQEGSPEVKMARQARGRKLAKMRVNEAVGKADVIITNPTHFSVAIQYDRSKMHAPMVVAKGQDYLALRIRELAAEHKVPIVPNPPLARQLYKQCEVGDFVPRNLFQGVAEVLAYVYQSVKGVRRAG